MSTKTTTTEKILAEALELHEKGVSLHSIVRTYPEHKEEIERLFGAMTALSLEKEKIRVPSAGLERLLAALPDAKPAASTVPAPIPSPFAGLASSLRFVLPLLALALLTGGFALHEGAVSPSALAPASTEKSASTPAPTATPPAPSPSAATGMPMMKMAALPTNASTTDRMVASFSSEAAQEATIASENDAETAAAVSAQKALITDPAPSSNEN